MEDAEERGAKVERSSVWLMVLCLWGIPMALLASGTLFFRQTAADLEIGGAFYHSADGWKWGDFPVFSLLYDFGTQPAALLALFSVVALLAGLWWAPLRRWRKISIYFLLVVVIAPGLLVNATLKEHWGRPRPREVTEFGGRHAFEKVLEYDDSSPGKSFPSGHASMGFCLFALYFIGRALRWRRAWLAALAALVLGSLLGLARIAQGGHFASDVLWSAGICYLVAIGLAKAMRLERQPFSKDRKNSPLVWVSAGGALFAAALLAVAIPFESARSIEGRDTDPNTVSAIDAKLDFRRAELAVRGGGRFRFETHIEAWGAIGSELYDDFEESVDAETGTLKLRLSQGRKGYFVASEQAASVELPQGGEGKVRIKVGKGSVRVELLSGEWDWFIEAPKGDIEILVPDGMQLKLSPLSVGGEMQNLVEGLSWSGEKKRWKRGESPTVRVRVVAGGDLRLVGGEH